MKKICILLTLAFCLQLSHAQQADYLDFSLGLKLYRSQDKFQSPLTYSGVNLVRSLGWSSYHEDKFSRRQFEFGNGALKNKRQYPQSLNLNTYAYNDYTVFRADEGQRENYFLGFSIKARMGSRSKGRSVQFETVTTVELVAAWNYRKNNSANWSQEAVFSIPVFAWAVRPRYANPLYLLPDSKIKSPSHLFLTIPKYMGYNFEYNIRHYLKNGNALRFAYQSSYFQLLPVQPLRVYNSGVVVTGMMKLN